MTLGEKLASMGIELEAIDNERCTIVSWVGIARMPWRWLERRRRWFKGPAQRSSFG